MDNLTVSEIPNADIDVGEHLPASAPQDRKSSLYHKIVAGVAILIIIGLGAYLYPKVSDKSKSEMTANVPETRSATPAPSVLSDIPWVLYHNTSTSSAVIQTFYKKDEGIFDSWGDYLFVGNVSDKGNVQISSLNLKNYKQQSIYDQSVRHDFADNRPKDLSDMQVIDNTLFFSIGGYLSDGATFWMSLPPTGETHKLTDNANARIEYWKDRYWLMSGEGDACWGITDYSLLNTKTKKVTHIAKSTTGCFEGEEYVDIDKTGRMLLAYHTAGQGDGGENGSGVYQYVIAVPLANPAAKEGVIAGQDMPPRVTEVVYIPESDKLFLRGEENYLYDLSTHMLEKTNNAYSLPSPTPYPKEPTFDEKIKSLKLPPGYTFSHELPHRDY